MYGTAAPPEDKSLQHYRNDTIDIDRSRAAQIPDPGAKSGTQAAARSRHYI